MQNGPDCGKKKALTAPVTAFLFKALNARTSARKRPKNAKKNGGNTAIVLIALGLIRTGKMHTSKNHSTASPISLFLAIRHVQRCPSATFYKR